MRLSVDEYDRLIEAGVLTEADGCELIDGHVLNKGIAGVYVFSPDQVAAAAAMGISISPSWMDVIAERPDLREQMQARLDAAPG
jgi:hypothetical protein